MSKQQVSQSQYQGGQPRPVAAGQGEQMDTELSLKERSRRNRKHRDETHAYVRSYN